MRTKLLDKNQDLQHVAATEKEIDTSMLLSTERPPINPHCCGFKSQAPEDGHHAWVTSDVRIPQQPLLSWSFVDDANSCKRDVKCSIRREVFDLSNTRAQNQR